MPISRRTLAIALVAAAGIAALAAAPQIPFVKQLIGANGDGDAGAPLVGGAFELMDQNGKSFTDQDLRGKVSLIYFGYTYCPDVCPVALQVMTAAVQQLGPDGDKVTPVFITIDPARDTQAVLKDYAANFDPRMVALSGAPDKIDAAARAWRVYYAKGETEPGDDPGGYLMAHSDFIYLMDRNGAYVAHFTSRSSPGDLAEAIRSLL